MAFGRTAMSAEEQRKQLSLYFPSQLVADLDSSKGPLSRNKLIVLILESACKNGIDLGKLVTEDS